MLTAQPDAFMACMSALLVVASLMGLQGELPLDVCVCTDGSAV